MNKLTDNIDVDSISNAIKQMTDKLSEKDQLTLDELRERICVGKSPIQLLNDKIKELDLLINVILTHLPTDERTAILETYHQALSAHYMKIISSNQEKNENKAPH